MTMSGHRAREPGHRRRSRPVVQPGLADCRRARCSSEPVARDD